MKPDQTRYHAEVKRAMQEANQLTLRFNHDGLGSEHLLGGLLQMDGTAASLLRDLGADVVRLKQAVLDAWVPGVEMVTGSRVPRRPCLTRALQAAAAVADELGQPEVDARHLLYGLAVCAGPAAEVLREAGITAAAVRGRIGGPGRAASAAVGRAPGGNGAQPNRC